VFGRELQCSYDSSSSYALWPTISHCKISSVDLSETFKAYDHSFSGTSAQKSAATVVWFDSPPNIDFLPKQILNDFPRLNGIKINGCNTFTIIRNHFFVEDFAMLQHLNIWDNKIETIEANAFQHLTKLKWIALGGNQLRSLPHQIFRNNPEIIFIFLYNNQINSITPDFFQNLSKLQRVDLDGSNQCIDMVFGCHSGSCSVSQSELDSELSTCYNNCLIDGECASKSGKLNDLSSKQIEQNIDLIVSSGHAETLIENGYSNLLIEKGYGDLIPRIDSKLEDTKKFEKMSKDLKTLKEDVKVQQDTIESLGNNLALLNQSNEQTINLFKENTIKALEATKEEVKDLTKMLMIQLENERLQFKLAEAKHINEKQAMEFELKTLKQEIVELKATLEESNGKFEQKLSEIIQKKFDDFTRKLMEDNRP
jgi:hypothetical protein